MDVVTKTKMSFRKEQWKQLIMDRQASGLTIEKWCQQQGLKKSTYYKWLRIIRADACQSLPDPTPSITVPFVKIGVDVSAGLNQPFESADIFWVNLQLYKYGLPPVSPTRIAATDA